MLHFTMTLGTTPAEQRKTLQTICNSQIAAIFSHPAFEELVKEEPELAMQQLLYLEAKTTLDLMDKPAN